MDNRTLTRTAGATGLLVVLIHLVVLVAGIGSDFARMALSDITPIPLTIGAAAACWWASRAEEGRARRSWIFLGGAMASWGIGEVIWTYYEIARGVEVPFPGWADAGYLAVIPLGFAAVLTLPTAPKGTKARLRTFLDGAIIAGSLLFVGWATVLGPSVRDSGGDLAYRTIALAYPVGDLVLIAVIVYVIARAQTRERSALFLIAGGLLSIALADFGFMWLNIQGMYSTGSLIDPLWDLGFVLIALGALRRPRFSASVLDERRIGVLSIAAPYIPFAMAFVTALVVQFTRGGLEPFLVWTGAAELLFLAIRQILALLDNMSLNRDLERRVDERTDQLMNALTQVEESRRLQDEFVANTSHELLTPLTIITASLETMQLEGESSPIVDMALGASARMRRLVEDILLTSGVEVRVDCEREPFDVAHAIRDVVAEIAPKYKSVRMDARASTYALGDEERFRMIVMHLVRNADKFAPGGSEIHVNVTTIDGCVDVAVSDEGPGIPDELREDVFRRFYQIDGSATRKFGGVGLGLFLARHLAEAMDGALVLEDSDRGARFRLTLPASALHIAGPDVDGMLFIPVNPTAA